MRHFDDIVETILKEDPRYARGAYRFVREGLEHAVKNQGIKESIGDGRQHITGQDLLSGIKEYALIQYGPLTKTLLDEWKVKKCEDFGEIVFNLVDHGVLGKTEHDSREDFKGGYNFHDAFEKPFLPQDN